MTDPKPTADSPESVPETAGDAPPPPGAEPAVPDALAEALARAEKAEAELARVKDGALRAMADAENVKKRAEREIGEREKYAIAGFAKGLLAVADNLRRALDSVSAEAKAADPALAKLVEGVELTERELLGTFEKNGVAKLDPVGKAPDPNFHQIVATVELPGAAPGTVAQVFQAGYTIHGRLLREAMVTVAKGAPAAPGGNLDTQA
ncbi:MAG: nucleotide exchange factor GrpE [Azospirillum sp.]|nr:nucleotide exchange factor GrpE [Azospirillum sp.]MCA3268249.1 nucleotide exchange factor GrpE [Azospirillum sp.]